MNYATNFALVENGIVENIIWGSVRKKEQYPNLIQIDDRAVSVGDEYIDGKFFHNGEEVKTLSEMMEDMRAALELLGVTE